VLVPVECEIFLVEKQFLIMYIGLKVKVKRVKLSLSVPRRHVMEAEVLLYSFLTLAIDGSEWSASHCGWFAPLKEPFYLLNKRLGGAQGWSICVGEEKNLLYQPRFKPQIVQAIA
jgi:hypothetical protein